MQPLRRRHYGSFGSIQYANAGFAELIGFDRGDLPGRSVRALHPGVTGWQRIAWSLLRRGGTWEGEFRGERRDGQEFWVSAHFSPIRDGTGAVTHLLGIHEDITRFRRPRHEWLDTLAATELPPEQPPDVALVVDVDGTILFASGGVAGVPIFESVGICIFSLVPRQHREKLRRYMTGVARSGTAVRFEIAGMGRRGSVSLYATQVGPIRRGGRVVALAFLTWDLSKAAIAADGEGALWSERAEHLRSLSQANSEGIIIHEGGLIVDANEPLARMHGYELAEVIGMEAIGLVAPESRGRVRAKVESGYEGSYQAVGLRKDGSTFPVEICGKNVRYRGRTVRVASIWDISGRRKAAPHAPGALAGAHNGGSRTEAGPATGAEVSHRELAVLELLAQGLTNREVAARLRVSARTVDHHVSHILNKLNVPNRTAAAVAAEQAGFLRAKSHPRVGDPTDAGRLPSSVS